jgi:adenosylcobinamide-GDP ribazoletransferase
MTEEQPFKPEQEASGFSLSAILVAAQFLTTMPPVIKRPFTNQELGRAVAFFPLVGLGLGLVLAAINALLNLLFPPNLSAALLLAAWILLTGVLHLDGFLDACDGLFGGFTPESRLHIMRDERVGAYALAGGVLLLLIKFTALTAVAEPAAVTTSTGSVTTALILVPTLGRWAISLAVVSFPYARETGLGRTMKNEAGPAERLLATAVTLIVAVFAGGLLGLVAMVAVALTVWLGSKYVMNRIPGLTGDIYGSLCEISEVVVLLILIAGASL